MEMRDKEFDQLFNSKLNDFEVEPSAEVWQNIAGELDGKKAKRSLVPYLSIAASIVVLASVSLWFFNQTQEKPDQHPVKMVKRTKPVKQQPGVVRPETAPDINIASSDVAISKPNIAHVPARIRQQKIEIQTPEKMNEETGDIPGPVVKKTEQILAFTPAEKVPVLKPAVSANDVALRAITLTDHPVEDIENHTEAVNIPSVEKAPVKKRAGGLGGFINTIVAAVDKREDKLIEFTDADNDEGSRVTGVNLGIFRIKKQ
jgi:hypothetical protein